MHARVANHEPLENENVAAMPIVLLTVALQVFCVVHLFRSGRSMTWLFLIILVPMVGSLAYLIIEVMPSLNQNPRRGKR